MTEYPNNYEEMLELWRSKLRKAQARHSAAVKKYRRASRDCKRGVLPSPHAALALQQAQREETAALQKCMQILIVFFLIREQPPAQV